MSTTTDPWLRTMMEYMVGAIERPANNAVGTPREKIRIEPVEVPVPEKTPAPVEVPADVPEKVPA